MKSQLSPLPVLVLACLFTSACASRDDFLMLVPHSKIEAHDAVAPVIADPAPTADPLLDSRLAALKAQAVRGNQAYISQLSRSQGALRKMNNASAGSEMWIRGQEVLSQLEVARTPTLDAQNALSQIYQDALSRMIVTDHITSLQGEVANMVAAQNKVLNAVQ